MYKCGKQGIERCMSTSTQWCRPAVTLAYTPYFVSHISTYSNIQGTASGLKISVQTHSGTQTDRDTVYTVSARTALACWHQTRELLITRLKLVRILAVPQPPNTLSKSDSSQNEMFFQEREIKKTTFSLSLSLSLPSSFAKYSGAQPPFFLLLSYSHTLSVSHPAPPSRSLTSLSLLSSPGTSMCFSLIEMHFNVVQISFLQL